MKYEKYASYEEALKAVKENGLALEFVKVQTASIRMAAFCNTKCKFIIDNKPSAE